MILSAAEQELVEAIRYTRSLTVIVHADHGHCEVRIARNGGEFAAGSGDSFDSAWRDITDPRHLQAGKGGAA